MARTREPIMPSSACWLYRIGFACLQQLSVGLAWVFDATQKNLPILVITDPVKQQIPDRVFLPVVVIEVPPLSFVYGETVRFHCITQ